MIYLLILAVIISLVRLGLHRLQRLQRGGQEEESPQGESLRWPLLLRRPPRSLPGPEARVFRLANKRKGRITVSDAVIDLGLSIHEAEELLNSMVDGLRVRTEVTPNGLVVYEFREILSRFQRT